MRGSTLALLLLGAAALAAAALSSRTALADGGCEERKEEGNCVTYGETIPPRTGFTGIAAIDREGGTQGLTIWASDRPGRPPGPAGSAGSSPCSDLYYRGDWGAYEAAGCGAPPCHALRGIDYQRYTALCPCPFLTDAWPSMTPELLEGVAGALGYSSVGAWADACFGPRPLGGPPQDPWEPCLDSILARYPWPRITINTNPGELALVGLPTWFWLENVPDPAFDGTVSVSCNVEGATHTVSARIKGWVNGPFAWDFDGDGSVDLVTSDPGRPYPQQPAITYTYEKSSLRQPGQAYTVSVTVTYAASVKFTVDGSDRPWISLGNVQVTYERLLPVQQAQSVITR